MARLRIAILLFFLAAYVFVVYRPFFLSGQLPVPADAIVGMYHPWRDSLREQYPQGVPVKNSLITDAVRQEYPWRQLAINQLKAGQYPSWNPYSFAGYPLTNAQSAPFYPLNFLYWLGDFASVWSWQVVLQTVLALVFMGVFLRNLKLRLEAVALGALAWAGCGFFVSWLETNVVVQSALWLPLIFLAVDKIYSGKKSFIWGLILLFSVISSFLAGHLQTAAYMAVTTLIYSLFRLVEQRSMKSFLYTLIFFSLAVGMSAGILFPVLQFLSFSARNADQAIWQKPDWFIPWQNAVQIVAPDFFGNPATQNYFGVWNYGEFVSYVGIIPLIFALTAALAFLPKSRFFTGLLILSALFAFPTFAAKIPFELNLPFISSAQPSRLIVLIDFALAVLAAMGFENILENEVGQKKVKTVAVVLISFTLVLAGIAWTPGLTTSLRNLILPGGLLLLFTGLIWLCFRLEKYQPLVIFAFLALTVFDLARFATKFESFSPREWLFPQTSAIKFLQEKSATDLFRIAPIDERILAQNFSMAYGLQSISGYDPLYLERYAEFITAVERNGPDISPPFGFNRIITPKNYDSVFFNLLGVKYVLSLEDLNSEKLVKVLQEGETRVYENKAVLPRAFFAQGIVSVTDKDKAIKLMFNRSFDVRRMAVVEKNLGDRVYTVGQAAIEKYSPNEIIIRTQNVDEGFLVLAEIYYPAWRAKIDSTPAEIFMTDYTFRGILVPAGTHLVRFWL